MICFKDKNMLSLNSSWFRNIYLSKLHMKNSSIILHCEFRKIPEIIFVGAKVRNVSTCAPNLIHYYDFHFAQLIFASFYFVCSVLFLQKTLSNLSNKHLLFLFLPENNKCLAIVHLLQNARENFCWSYNSMIFKRANVLKQRKQ